MPAEWRGICLIDGKRPIKAVYEVESENLAVPEVHIREDDTAAHDTKKPEAEEEITYENVAIPEIHIKKKAAG